MGFIREPLIVGLITLFYPLADVYDRTEKTEFEWGASLDVK
jgi:hypothetical protein